MNYLSSLQCKTEPFASPAGAEIFVYQAVRGAIAKISRNILNGGGLQLVIGEAGSGKTTLLKRLAQKFRADNRTVVLLLDNPRFKDLQQFLITVAGVFKTIKAPAGFDDDTFQKAFNSFFFKLCREEKKIVLLLIDNGQYLPDFCLQALRSFYDHHPDCKRLLQTVIGGKPSLQAKINADNSLNRLVASFTTPEPFRFADTRKLIRFHLEGAATDPGCPPALFTLPAQWIIYRLTQGHPRKIIDLCRYLVLTLAIENRKKADWFMTLRSAKVLIPGRAHKLQIIRTTSLSSLVILTLVFGIWSEQSKTSNLDKPDHLLPAAVPQKMQTAKTQPVATGGEPADNVQAGQNRAGPATVAAVVEKKPPLLIPAEEKIAEAAAAEKSAGNQDAPGNKIPASEVPVPQTGIVARDQAPSPAGVDAETEPPAAAAAAALRSGASTDSVPEPLPADASGHGDGQVKPPEDLGAIITAPGETFGDMIRRIYGPWSFNPENARKVKALNPDLKNPEMLNVGDKIRFPAIPVALTPEAEKTWWVRITAFDSLQSAYRFLRKSRKSLPPMLIIPSRDDTGQVHMNILMEEYFVDNDAAQKAIDSLPPAIKAGVETLHGLDPATFYYSLKQED